jgi:hypothetical protein
VTEQQLLVQRPDELWPGRLPAPLVDRCDAAELADRLGDDHLGDPGRVD